MSILNSIPGFKLTIRRKSLFDAQNSTDPSAIFTLCTSDTCNVPRRRLADVHCSGDRHPQRYRAARLVALLSTRHEPDASARREAVLEEDRLSPHRSRLFLLSCPGLGLFSDDQPRVRHGGYEQQTEEDEDQNHGDNFVQSRRHVEVD